MAQPIVTRFAPSPTGHLHIGGARTALFCWAFARRVGGSFLLRIEDTDQARSSEASARGIMEDLAWLGIAWDQGPTLERPGGDGPIGGDPRGVGPFYQSQRLDRYDAVVESMLERGLAYADFTSAAEIDAMRKAAAGAKQTFRYHPPASALLPLAQQRARMRAGEAHVIRFRAPEEPVRVVDEVLGEVAFGAGEVDDFVLRKGDGFPTYHFGVVVDDEQMGVTHVLRGQEHLMNTPRHVALQKALGYRTPVYAHMPLIFNDQGAKMSKRERDQAARAAVKQKGLGSSPVGAIDQAAWAAWLADSKRQLETGQLEGLGAAMGLVLPEVSVEDFRKAGYLPEVICNFIALLGWNPGTKDVSGANVEKFDMAYLSSHFDLERIGKTNARFDRKKLSSFNADALGAMSDEAFAARWRTWCERFDPRLPDALDAQRFVWLARAVKPRCKTLADAAKPASFVLLNDDGVPLDEGAVGKHLAGGSPRGLDTLAALEAVIGAIDPFTPEAISAAIEAFAGARGLGMGAVAQPLRVAITGTGVSPGLGETLAVLGKARVMARIGSCLRRAGTAV